MTKEHNFFLWATRHKFVSNVSRGSVWKTQLTARLPFLCKTAEKARKKPTCVRPTQQLSAARPCRVDAGDLAVAPATTRVAADPDWPSRGLRADMYGN